MLTKLRYFALSHHDYCSQLLSPHGVRLIAEMEIVQRCFTRKFESMKKLGYWKRLKELFGSKTGQIGSDIFIEDLRGACSKL